MRSSARNASPCSISSNQENCLHGNAPRRTRRRLQERFEGDCDCSSATTGGRRLAEAVDRSEKPWASFALPTLSKTLNSVQTTFDTLSQKFRRSTKRRQQLKNEPSMSPATPQTRSRRLLGRTPTKLYSPFGIESPRHPLRETRNQSKDRDLVSEKEGVYSDSCCKSSTQGTINQSLAFGEKNFDPDMEEVRIGIWELRQTAHRIVKHSSLQH